MRLISITGFLIALAIMGNPTHCYSQGIELGLVEYLNSCASCHGVSGKGDGPVAKSIKKAPADLTKLSQGNNGVFPVSRISDVIDGRVEVEIHGTRDMPVWGKIYTPSWGSMMSSAPPFYASKEVVEALIRVRILALVEYISTLQAK